MNQGPLNNTQLGVDLILLNGAMNQRHAQDHVHQLAMAYVSQGMIFQDALVRAKNEIAFAHVRAPKVKQPEDIVLKWLAIGFLAIVLLITLTS